MTSPASALSGTGGLPHHGGDLDWARANFPLAPKSWIDLSTGINPAPYPVVAARCDRLPTPAALDSLLDAARRYYGMAGGDALAAVAGVELAIRLLPHLETRKRRVGIVGPTYASHAEAWRAAGHTVRVVATVAAILEDCDIAVVVSPNNPDGRSVAREELAVLADRLHRKQGFLVADRSFADVEEDPAALPCRPGLVELRSFGKFFGLPGLRLGFVLGDAARLPSVLGAWPVSAAAIATGRLALLDRDWHAATRAGLAEARARLDDILGRHGTIVGGTDLFRLLRAEDAASLFRHLASRAILTRIFDYDARWIRFGLPADAAARTKLADALNDFPENAR